MATTFHLQIVTPDRMVYDGEAERILVRAVNGDVCILARHIDFATPLGIGTAKVVDGEGCVRMAACNGGLLNVSRGEVRVVATTFEWQDEIDLERAEKAQQNAQEKLSRLSREDQAYELAQAKLKRALARIEAHQ